MNTTLLRLLALLGTLLCLSSCAGYQLGGQKPKALASIHSVHVPLVVNRTLFPRAEALTTNSLVDALTQDGTYRVASPEKADAVLLVELASLDYSQARSSEFDTLRSEELEMKVTLRWKLQAEGKVLEKGTSTGQTRFFARGNLQTSRAGALPDALYRATRHLVSRLADGF